jgi:prepilin-type N-terminal cleavage/methylation domain-containing protein
VIRRREPDEQGMTLVELMVAMFATAILLAGVGTVFVGALRSLRVVTAKADLTSDAQLAMQTMTGRLRAADYVQPADTAYPNIPLTATATSIKFLSYLSNQTLATQLANAIDAVAPGNTVGPQLRATGLVPDQVEYKYVATGCGSGALQSGMTETVTAPAPLATPSATGGLLSWPGTGQTRCVLRTTSAVSLRYFSGCALTDPVIAAPVTGAALNTIKSVEVTATASDTSGRQIRLLNQTCLVNVVP